MSKIETFSTEDTVARQDRAPDAHHHPECGPTKHTGTEHTGALETSAPVEHAGSREITRIARKRLGKHQPAQADITAMIIGNAARYLLTGAAARREIARLRKDLDIAWNCGQLVTPCDKHLQRSEMPNSEGAR